MIEKPGLYLYTPELGEKIPDCKVAARMSYYGEHYIVDTPFILSGRGITEVPVSWQPGCQEDAEHWKSYRVTKRAFEKLQTEYPIRMPCFLD